MIILDKVFMTIFFISFFFLHLLLSAPLKFLVAFWNPVSNKCELKSYKFYYFYKYIGWQARLIENNLEMFVLFFELQNNVRWSQINSRIWILETVRQRRERDSVSLCAFPIHTRNCSLHWNQHAVISLSASFLRVSRVTCLTSCTVFFMFSWSLFFVISIFLLFRIFEVNGFFGHSLKVLDLNYILTRYALFVYTTSPI